MPETTTTTIEPPTPKRETWFSPNPVKRWRQTNDFRKRRPRAWYWISVALAFFVGVIGSSDPTAGDKLASMKAERDVAQADLIDVRAALKEEENRTPEGEAAEIIADAKAAAASEKADAAARMAAAIAREKKATAVEKQAAKNVIAGEGTYVVGADIRPGTYKSSGQPGCYYARLSSLDTMNGIIENGNQDGPVVVGVLKSDKALHVSGCAEFRRVSS